MTKLIKKINWLYHEMLYGRVNNNNIVLHQETNSMKTPLSIAFVKMAENGDIDEVTASENVSLFLEWQISVKYPVNALLQYEGLLYRVLQEHVSQADWTPDKTPSLYKVLSVSENGVLNWSRPISNVDAYMIGDECMFNGVHKRSTIDNNVWSPDEYPAGWEDVVTKEVIE